jgi:hypothetical protein
VRDGLGEQHEINMTVRGKFEAGIEGTSQRDLRRQRGRLVAVLDPMELCARDANVLRECLLTHTPLLASDGEGTTEINQWSHLLEGCAEFGIGEFFGKKIVQITRMRHVAPPSTR